MARGRAGSPAAKRDHSERPAPNGTEATSFMRSLEAFLAVHENRSFSAAARELSISQPTVSQRIQNLEASLGLELFHRGQGRVEPTAAGRALTVYAERMLGLRDEMLGELRGLATLARGTLRIAASTTPGNYIMPPLLQRFRERFTEIRVVLQIGDSEQVLERLREGAVELGIVGSTVTDGQLHCEPFIEDEIVVIARPGHPLVARPEVSLAELAEHSWVVREVGSGTRKSVETMLAQAALGKLRIGMEMDSTEAIKLAVRAGEGIALVSRRAVENELKLGLLGTTRLPGAGLRRQFYAVRPQQRTLSPAAEGLWKLLLGNERVRG